jgi:hypothetical protein
MQFTIKNGNRISLDISKPNKTMFKAYDTKFLGLHIDSTLSWKLNIEQILHMLSAACYTLRSFKPYISQEIMKMVYCAYFHSTMSYGIIFWRNSTDSTKIFKIQRGQLELPQEAGIETLAEIYLKI